MFAEKNITYYNFDNFQIETTTILELSYEVYLTGRQPKKEIMRTMMMKLIG